MTKFTNCNDCTTTEYFPCTEHCVHNPRNKDLFKIQEKIVDWSKLVGSNVDMEFSDYKDIFEPWASKLIDMGINKGIPYYKISEIGRFKYCRIRENHWQAWGGGECPLPEGLVIDVRTRQDGDRRYVSSYNEPHWNWKHNQFGSDIIAYKVRQAAHGWTY